MRNIGGNEMSPTTSRVRYLPIPREEKVIGGCAKSCELHCRKLEGSERQKENNVTRKSLDDAHLSN